MEAEAVETAVRSEAVPFPPLAAPLKLEPSIGWKATQLVADFLTVFLAAFGSYWFYLQSGIGRSDFNPALYLRIDVTLAAIMTFALHGQGAYRGQLGLLRIESVRRIIKATAASLLLLLAISFFVRIPAFSRLNVLLLGPAIVLGLVTQRFALWRYQEKARVRVAAPVLLYGADETGRLLAQHLLEEHALGLRPVGFLDDRSDLRFEEVRVGPGIQGERLRVLGGEDDLKEIVHRTGASAVFIAMPNASSDRIAVIVARLEALGIPFFCVPNSGGLLFSTLRFGQIAGMPVFTRRRVNAERFYELAKRALDVTVSAIGLAVSLPVLALSALLVRSSSKGPVFFRQERAGKNGRRFTILKLRTMREDSPAYALHPRTTEDPRITAVGRWLRRLSLDEIPQFWNVIRGEMSLVGPRPEMPFVVADYGDIEWQRLTVKPGVTGLWQISADRAFRIHDNIQYDLYYVENRSLTLDLAILLVTPFALLARDRAV